MYLLWQSLLLLLLLCTSSNRWLSSHGIDFGLFLIEFAMVSYLVWSYVIGVEKLILNILLHLYGLHKITLRQCLSLDRSFIARIWIEIYLSRIPSLPIAKPCTRRVARLEVLVRTEWLWIILHLRIRIINIRWHITEAERVVGLLSVSQDLVRILLLNEIVFVSVGFCHVGTCIVFTFCFARWLGIISHMSLAFLV